jgi:hypothetical protein
MCGSAPLFVALGGYYLVEPLQMLVASWFILVMTRAPAWPPALTLGHLLAASACALLAKQTTPLFCVWPGLIALVVALYRVRKGDAWGWQTRAAQIVLLAGGLLGLGTSIWYWRNWQTSVAYVVANTRGPVAAIWGKEDAFLETLRYWIKILASTLVIPSLVLLVLVLVAGGIAYRLMGDRYGASRHLDMCGLAGALQVVTVLVVFSLSANHQPRFLLPVLPAAALVVCWSVAQFSKGWLTGLAIIVFAAQLAWVWGFAFGLLVVHPGGLQRQIDDGGQEAALLQSIVTRTCRDVTTASYTNTIAIDPAFRGDWLAPEPANYVASRDAYGRSRRPACEYDYLGGGFLGEGADRAWDDMVSKGVRYVVTVDPRVHSVPTKTYNRALDGTHFPLFWSTLERSPLFAAESPLSEDRGIVIFRRVDRK